MVDGSRLTFNVSRLMVDLMTFSFCHSERSEESVLKLMVDLMTFSFCHSERSEESVLKLMVDS